MEKEKKRDKNKSKLFEEGRPLHMRTIFIRDKKRENAKMYSLLFFLSTKKCRRPESNRHGVGKLRGILSPLRLPIPPLRL